LYVSSEDEEWCDEAVLEGSRTFDKIMPGEEPPRLRLAFLVIVLDSERSPLRVDLAQRVRYGSEHDTNSLFFSH
jgi:hypothetical protein